jgi:glycosyltransferase involved in cell wall biosynthesis
MNSMEIGGVEVGVLSLLKSKLNSDYRVMTVGGCNPNIYSSLSEDEKSRLYICNGYFKAFLLLIKLKPSVVVSSLWRAHFVSLLYKIIKPSINRIHFLHVVGFAHIVDKIIFKLSMCLTDFVFCDSVESQSYFTTLYNQKKSVVIPMNVSFSNEKKIINFNPINFVFVGRFCKQKNIFKSIDFIKELNEQGVIASFDLYGRDDGELDALTRYVSENELTNLVHFHDSLLPTVIESEMRKYNYYLQTSYREGMAISVFQAIKNGLLPVVTPVGEIEKYTKDGYNAFYLDINNLKLSVNKFKQLIENHDIENFNVGSIVNEDEYPVFDESFFSAVNNFIAKY